MTIRFFTSVAAAAFLIGSVASAQAPASASLSPGKDLYLKYSCYACHGYDGHGGPGARLVPLAMTVPRFTASLRTPRRMPPYTAKVLSDAQLADLFAYIKSLPVSPPPDQIPLLTRIMAAGK
jgi:mono/diheme cytochrome c family protein